MKNIATLLADVPPWVVKLAPQLMEQAEQLYKNGATKKEYVIEGLKLAAKFHDIPLVPEPIEAAIEAQIIEAVVNLLFKSAFEVNPHNKFMRKMRKAKRKIDAGKLPYGSYWNETFGEYSQPGMSTYNAETSKQLWDKFNAWR
jgi:hypothetical protein